jgi:hypothetical protein
MLRALLLCCAVAALSCQRAKLQRVLPEGVRVDLLPQSARAQLDTLFVVDNADHITPHQQKVAQSFSRFLAYLDQNQIDYHIGLVSTDVANQPAQYLGGGDKHYFASGDGNVAQGVAAAVLGLGDKGSPVEAALQQLDLSLRQPPAGFLRSGAALFLVAVTDDDDPWSPGEDLYYYRAIKQAKGAGNDGLVTFSAIAGDVPNGCTIRDPQNPANSFVADPAARLQGLALQTGGVFHSLCDPSFDAVFDQLGATAAGLKRAFRLAKVPDLTTLVVSVRAPCGTGTAALAACAQKSDECGEPTPAIVCTPRQGTADGWSYDAPTNSLLFAGASLPPRGSLIEAQYKERTP